MRDDERMHAGSLVTMAEGNPPSGAHRATAIRVVIIDDHRLVADSVAAVLDHPHDISVVGVAATCADGLAQVRSYQPDVLILDQRLPDGLGTDLLPAVQHASPATRTLLVTASDSDDVLHRAIEAGCAGFVAKGERVAALVDAVRRVAAGELVLSSAHLARLIPALAHRKSRTGQDLTARERDVLRLLAQGRTTAFMAAALFIAPATVRNHIQSVISKLGAHTKLEAVTVAMRENIVGTE
jgi:DNA-binding NarL/FixJ family response regulator